MLKLKPFISKLFTKYNSLYRIYSKTAENTESALSLADALGAEAKLPFSIQSKPNIDSNLTLIEKTPTQALIAGSDVLNAKKVGKACSKSDKSCTPKKPQKPCPPGDTIKDECDFYEFPKENAKKWQYLAYVALPMVLVLSVIIIGTREETKKADFIPYPYLYKRLKDFPWGDGRKSFFHGHNNYIREEEEERIDREIEERRLEIQKEREAAAAAAAAAAAEGGESEIIIEGESEIIIEGETEIVIEGETETIIESGTETVIITEGETETETETIIVEGPRYKSSYNEMEEKLELRALHAQEELERRRQRHEAERAQ